MTQPHSLDPFVKHFVNSKLTPDDARKGLLEMGIPPEIVDQAYKEFLKLAGKRKYLSPPAMLVENKSRENAWYPGADEFPDARFWPVLRDYLSNEKGWDRQAVSSIHDASDKIVAWLESPWAARINTRGLVVGYVQSGKTANFTAVIAKAADAGYRFFIVLSGTKKSLRSQTQQRLERELVFLNDEVWFTPTSVSDFRPLGNNANFFLSDKKHDKVLCVVKKNTAVLRKLIKWLKSASPEVLRRCPFLIIDDEADEASVNTASNQTKTKERSVINRHLVDLLKLLPKAAYVGYTATPFANVFIDPSPGDLYPSDFIVTLPKPSNHFGTERIFGRDRLLDEETEEEFEGLDMVRLVPDDEILRLRSPKQNDHAFVPEITESLTDAIHYFWLACAARFARGQNDQHCTMLIHTTQLIAVHNKTREVVESYRRSVIRKLGGSNYNDFLQDLRRHWADEQERVPSREFGHKPVPFDELLPYFQQVVDQTLVVVDNSQSDFRLSYDEQEPRIQIAIGGNTLSRGLTLEGLLVSFFLRAAGAYDTLLQMGRWFGYRPGYEDLPRLWMTAELYTYFRDLATIEAEIRRDIEDYDRMGITPQEFGIRIRTHPDLNITAPLKMQHAVPAEVSYGEKGYEQTFMFDYKDRSALQRNIAAAGDLVSGLERSDCVLERERGHLIFRGVPVSSVVTFLRKYSFCSGHRALNSKLLIDYIKDQNDDDYLLEWNVVIRGVTARDSAERGTITLGSFEVLLLDRARRKFPEDHAHIGALMTQGDSGIDLKRDRRELRGLSDKSLRIIRQEDMPRTGLLIIYPISKDSIPHTGKNKTSLDAVEHVIGLGIIFPKAVGDKRGAQSYMTVDPSKLQRVDFELDEEEDEDA